MLCALGLVLNLYAMITIYRNNFGICMQTIFLCLRKYPRYIPAKLTLSFVHLLRYCCRRPVAISSTIMELLLIIVIYLSIKYDGK